jgi:hypothetical protein
MIAPITRSCAAVLFAALIVGGCTPTQGTSRGVVTDVEGTLEEVIAFTVLVGGEELRFVPVEDGDYAFPLAHLREHQRTGEAVLVDWEVVESVRYASSLKDE